MEMDSSKPSGINVDLESLLNEAKKAGEGIDAAIEQFDFLPEEHGIDV
eukprot:CAMPEP_0168317484 /NCGR_PEP_ID=MMETSP0210-20121227/25596_1 /TAXON_ID=40633 /ORGANISM="Condylostoma magnum, Strain COL2" /LENGTH=47 /DNA_ID= /DNA_START= /DNA_END= /DNA_ORIENTATION=